MCVCHHEIGEIVFCRDDRTTYTFSHSTHTNTTTAQYVLYNTYNDMYMHMTTISDFMSFSA